MKILGLDSSGLVAGAAVAEGGILLAEYNINYKKTHSQTLLPMLEELRRMLELDLDTLDAIAIASGPGSFTGLRIGSATAKGLGLALGKPLVEVPTLEGLAYNLCGVESWVCPMMDARRGQVYTGIYEFVQTTGSDPSKSAETGDPQAVGAPELQGDAFPDIPVLREVERQAALGVTELLGKLNALGERQPGRKVIFLGDGVDVYREIIRREIKIPYAFAPGNANRQRAGSIAILGEIYFRRGHAVVAAAEHRPEYLRQSQAERELAEKAEHEPTEKAERESREGRQA